MRDEYDGILRFAENLYYIITFIHKYKNASQKVKSINFLILLRLISGNRCFYNLFKQPFSSVILKLIKY